MCTAVSHLEDFIIVQVRNKAQRFLRRAPLVDGVSARLVHVIGQDACLLSFLDNDLMSFRTMGQVSVLWSQWVQFLQRLHNGCYMAVRCPMVLDQVEPSSLRWGEVDTQQPDCYTVHELLRNRVIERVGSDQVADMNDELCHRLRVLGQLRASVSPNVNIR